MTYVVNEECIKCKYTDCVEVCPVDCFYEGATMLVINPDECIDCGVCVPECPVEAIRPDTESSDLFIQLNKEYSLKWSVITESKPADASASEFEAVSDKYKNYFSPDPA